MNTVDRMKLISKLEQVLPGLASREIVQQSSCFVFQDGRVKTFNEEVFCSCRVKGFPTEFQGAVQAKPLLDILRKLQEDSLTVKTGGEEIRFSGVKKNFGVRMQKEILLPVHEVEEPDSWKELADDFTEGTSLVQECAGKDSSTVYINVRLTPSYIEATDNAQMSRYKIAIPIKESIFVRQSAIKHLTNLELTHISESGSWLHFKNANGLIISLRKYYTEFPKLSEFFKLQGKKIKLPRTLAAAVDKAEVFSKIGESNLVDFTLERGRLLVKGKGDHGWFSEEQKIKYKGPTIRFRTSPALIKDIVKRHSIVQVTEDHQLKIESGNFTYCAMLDLPENS